MKNKDKIIYDYILNITGIGISDGLEALILNPKRMNSMNNAALEQIVREFAPIHKKYKYVLDGPAELRKITMFEIFLSCRLEHKPELQKLLDE